MCPKRKEQVDWKIGVKHCPRGHRNHLDEDYCIECDYPFGDNPVRHRPRPWRFRSWTAIAILLGLLVSPLIFVIAGWKQPAPPENPTTEQQLASRILKLERKVGWLEGQVQFPGHDTGWADSKICT